MPYDRPATTMSGFDLCPECMAEYENPHDRRFHAQPIACPTCGPQLSYIRGGEIVATRDEAARTRSARYPARENRCHQRFGWVFTRLRCPQPGYSQELRRRKHRSDKAFALMAFDLETIRSYCQVNAEQADLLSSRQMPIVILDESANVSLPVELAPGQSTLGFMLPYTPLHILLCQPNR